MQRIISVARQKFGLQFIRYVLVGVSSLLVDYGTFYFLYYIADVSLAIATPAGLAVGFVYGFAMNRLWAFGNRKRRGHHAVHTQFIFTLILLGFNSIFSYYCIHFLERRGISAAIGKILTVGCIALWNFFIYKLIFKEKEITESNAIY